MITSRALGIGLAALLCALLTGCGTARVDVHTTVVSPDEVRQEMTLRADGLLAEALGGTLDAEELRRDGWEVEKTSEGNTVVIRMNSRVAKGEGIVLPSSPSPTKIDSSLAVNDGLFGREYSVRLSVPALLTPTPTPQPTATPTARPTATATRTPTPRADGRPAPAAPPAPSPFPTFQPPSSTGFEQMGEQLAEQLIRSSFKMTWTVTLPGELTETNADSRSANSGTWDLGYERLKQGFEMKIASRERRFPWPLLAGGAAVSAVAAAGIAGYLLRRAGRRRAQPDPASEREEQRSPPTMGQS